MIIPTPYKKFIYLIELEDDIELFEDEFNATVLKNVDIKSYNLITKFIESLLEVYTLLLYDVSETRDSNIPAKMDTENVYLKTIFVRFIEQQNIAQAIHVLLLKNSSKNSDDSYGAILETLSSKSFSKNNLFVAIKDDITNSKIAKYLINKKNIIALAKYLQKEILLRIDDTKNRFRIGKMDNELLVLENEIVSFITTMLEEVLLEIIKKGESVEAFWDNY